MFIYDDFNSNESDSTEMCICCQKRLYTKSSWASPIRALRFGMFRLAAARKQHAGSRAAGHECVPTDARAYELRTRGWVGRGTDVPGLHLCRRV